MTVMDMRDVSEMFSDTSLYENYFEMEGKWRITSHIDRHNSSAEAMVASAVGTVSSERIKQVVEWINGGRAFYIILHLNVYRCGASFAAARTPPFLYVDQDGGATSELLRTSYEDLKAIALGRAKNNLEQLMDDIGIEEVLLAVHGS